MTMAQGVRVPRPAARRSTAYVLDRVPELGFPGNPDYNLLDGLLVAAKGRHGFVKGAPGCVGTSDGGRHDMYLGGRGHGHQPQTSEASEVSCVVLRHNPQSRSYSDS